MFKTVLQSALDNLDNNFTHEDLAKQYLIEYLKSFDAEDELSDEDSETDEGRATRTREVEIEFGEDNYIVIEIKGFYRVEEEPQTYDYPGSYEEIYEDYEVLSVSTEGPLTEEEINKYLS